MEIDPYVLKMGVISFFVIFCSLILQQAGRAFIADRLGDDTPRLQGRKSLNPAAHIDLFGTIVLPLLAAFRLLGPIPIIGWARPLDLNPGNFHHRKLGEIIMTLAAPGMFFLIALVAAFGAIIASYTEPSLMQLFRLVLQLNLALGVINLLPIPPIEISKFYVYLGLMQEETHARWSFYGGFILLFLLMAVPPFQEFLIRLIVIAHFPFELLIHALRAS